MNKKRVITILVVVGGIILLGVGLLVYRNLNQQPVETVEQNESLDAEALLGDDNSSESETVIKEDQDKVALDGVFQDADAVHSGSGTATITETADGPVLLFSKDFQVTSGPDLLVYLSPNEAADPLGEFVSLGELKSTSGAQAYNLPDNYKDYKSVTVWCRAFGVQFTYANLR